MKKRKTYEVGVINKTYSKTYSDQTKFYTSDTALELNFQLKEVEYDFDSAEIILLNVDDRSLVTRPVVKSAEGFTYELEDDIVEHYGEWKGQLKFNEGGEIYVSSPVVFRIENDLNNDRPPKLTDVRDWETLRQSAKDLIAELGDVVANESARIEAEKQRVEGYQEMRNIIDNFEIGVNSVGTENVKDGAVTPDKTTFVKKGKNLFEGNFIHGIAVTGGVGSNGKIVSSAGSVVAIIKVTPGLPYRTSFSPESQNNRLRIAASQRYPKVGDTVRVASVQDSLKSLGVSLNTDENYLIVYLDAGTGTEPLEFQVEQNTYQTSYESPFKVGIDFLDKSIPQNAVVPRYGFLNGYPESFDISFSNQTITTDSNCRLQVGSNRIHVPVGVYSFEGLNTNALTVAYNLSDETVSIIPSANANDEAYEKHIILGFLSRPSKSTYIFGNFSLEGSPAATVTERDLKASNNVTSSEKFIADKVSGNYVAEVPEFNVYNRNIETHLYPIYDSLVSEFPEYVSRTLLENDESGLPIYRYDFKPTQLVSDSEPIKIIATCMHGHEVHATYGLAFFFDDLARNWKTKDVLRMLRWNVHFIVVPNANPYGFNNGQRTNYNGVDLARNFSANWSSAYTDINYDNPGTSPLSEVGTQVIDQLLKDNLDATFVLDNHNFGGDPSTGGQLLYISTSNQTSQIIGEQHVRNIGTISKLSGYVSPEKVVGRVETTTKNGSLAAQIDSYNLIGFLLETSSVLNGSSSSQGKSDLLRLNIESAGNALLTPFNYFTK